MKIIEGMGFTEEEAKAILFSCPLVYKCKFEDKVQTNFEVLHEKVQVSANDLLHNFAVSTKIVFAHQGIGTFNLSVQVHYLKPKVTGFFSLI